jgi:heptose-I-phosphate ethanolaminephosphotransferase
MLFKGQSGIDAFKYIIPYVTSFTLIPLFFPKITKPWVYITGFILWIFSLANLFYFFNFQQELSQSVFFVIFESNLKEGFEFFGNYLSWGMLPGFLIFSAAALYFAKKVTPFTPHNSLLIAVCAVSLFYHLEPAVKHWQGFNKKTEAIWQHKIESRYMSVTPFNFILSYHRYLQQSHEVQAYLDYFLKNPHLIPVSLKDKTQRQTYVLIIGESTNRQRMGLYGYARNTSPKLKSMGKALSIFQDVVSPRPFTIEALSEALTFSNQTEHIPIQETHNVISLMKSAGFKTFWLTNQQTISSRNILLTVFSQMADAQVYLNQNLQQNSKSLDSRLLAPLKTALADPADKKLIVVHLLGTHAQYQFRYPESYDVFKGTFASNPYMNLSAKNRRLYNSYDNAVLFNDTVVYDLISTFKQSNPYGALVYFSDHGEEVFDVENWHGRNEDRPTRAMHTVPFLLWGSARWKQNHHAGDFEHYLLRPYSLEHFLHTWCDLVALQISDFKPSRSILNAAFKPQTRWIGDPGRPKTLQPYESLTS